jgi:hypothetical protein
MTPETTPNPDNLPVLAETTVPLGESLIEIDRKPGTKQFLPAALYADRTRSIRTSEITLAQLNTFLDELEKTGLWELSARRAGMNARSMRKITKMDSDFATMCDDALENYKDTVIRELHERAVVGWDEPVFSHKLGVQIGTIRRKDGKLLELLAKKLDPSFRDNGVNVNVNNAGGVIVVPAAPISTEAWIEASKAKPVESKIIEPQAPSDGLPPPEIKPDLNSGAS